MDLTWSRTAKHGATSLSQRPEKGSPEELLYFVPPTEEAFLKLLSERLGCRQQARKAEKVLTFYSSKKGFGPTQTVSSQCFLLYSSSLQTYALILLMCMHTFTMELRSQTFSRYFWLLLCIPLSTW